MSEIAVYYNASCPVCRTEIEHYRRISDRHQLAIGFRDVSGDAWCPRDRQAMLLRLHVEDGAQMFVGVDAFLRLWRELPGYRWLARLVA